MWVVPQIKLTINVNMIFVVVHKLRNSQGVNYFATYRYVCFEGKKVIEMLFKGRYTTFCTERIFSGMSGAL